MGEFAVYALGTGSLVVDVQSDLLEPFATRVVIPLLAPEHAPQAPHRLNPVFEVAGSRRILATQLLAALPRPSSEPQSARWPRSAMRSGRRSTCCSSDSEPE